MSWQPVQYTPNYAMLITFRLFLYPKRHKYFQNNDGEIDAEDLKTYWTKLKRVLTKNLPDASGFSLGFFYGMTH